MSYAAAKATSKEKHLFGKGSIDGLMAAETGDMASIPGHIIPCLALGIPGSAPSAVLMAAMIIHGIQPGPMMMISHPHFVYEVVAMTSLATITILIFGLFLVKPLLVILKIRRTVLMPIIFLLCTVGAFATASRLFDVYAMLVIGIGAFFLRRRGYQMAPFVLGLVLGPLLDKSLRRGLVLSDGSLAPFFTRPISLAFAVVTIFAILLYVPAFKAAVRRVTGGAGAASARRSAAAARRGRRHEDRALQRGARPRCRSSDAVRARRRARLRRPRDRAVHARRRAASASTPPRRSASAASSKSTGLVVTGLHWLLVRPAGLSRDRSRRRRVRAAHARGRDAPDRPVRRARRQRARARLAEAARDRRRRNARDGARAGCSSSSPTPPASPQRTASPIASSRSAAPRRR